jgi:hypothetical protein
MSSQMVNITPSITQKIGPIRPPRKPNLHREKRRNPPQR